jgi:anaerobic magnesium-protoporphyrin IX monomethyl ester cyclase
MNVVLIYPRYKTRMAGGLEEPLGLLYIASTLRSLGHSVTLFDLSFAHELGHMAGGLARADWVGFSSSSPLFGKAVEVLAYVKSVAPGVPVIIGGPHASIAPDEALSSGFDYAVLGEGETIIREFVSLLAQGRACECPGVASRANGATRINPRRDFIADLDALPFPARDLVDYSRYPTIGMIASRGCPFKCLYCKPMLDGLFGSTVRHRSAANVVDEIELAVGIAGNREVYFKDDTLTVLPLEWFKEFGAALKKKKLSIRWQANSRVDTVTFEKLALMKELGCRQMGFGVESGSPRVLEFYRKHANPAQAEQVFGWCHKLGILPHAFIMLGAPEEKIEDMELTYKFLKKIKPRSWTVCTTTPFPGNDLFTYAKEHDILNVKGFEDYDNAENSLLGRMPMKLRYISAGDIKRYRDKINRHLFMINVVNPKVIMKAVRRPGAAFHKLWNMFAPSK